jgi:hypothetical protein
MDEMKNMNNYFTIKETGIWCVQEIFSCLNSTYQYI